MRDTEKEKENKTIRKESSDKGKKVGNKNSSTQEGKKEGEINTWPEKDKTNEKKEKGLATDDTKATKSGKKKETNRQSGKGEK